MIPDRSGDKIRPTPSEAWDNPDLYSTRQAAVMAEMLKSPPEQTGMAVLEEYMTTYKPDFTINPNEDPKKTYVQIISAEAMASVYVTLKHVKDSFDTTTLNQVTLSAFMMNAIHGLCTNYHTKKVDAARSAVAGGMMVPENLATSRAGIYIGVEIALAMEIYTIIAQRILIQQVGSR